MEFEEKLKQRVLMLDRARQELDELRDDLNQEHLHYQDTIKGWREEVSQLMTEVAEADELRYQWFHEHLPEFCSRALQLRIITVSESEKVCNAIEFVDLLLTKLEGGDYTPLAL